MEPAVEAGAEAATPAVVEPTKLASAEAAPAEAAPAEAAPAQTAPVKTAPAETAPAGAAPAEAAPAGAAPAEAAPAASGVKRKAAPLPRVTMHGSQDAPSHRVHRTRMCNPKLQAGPEVPQLHRRAAWAWSHHVACACQSARHEAISPQSPRNLPAISPASSAPSPTACTSAPQVARLAPPQSIIAAAAAERDRTNKAGPLRPLPPSDFDKKPAGKQVGGFGSSCSDRFAGPDSRYKKGWRQSTMPILDDAVYRAKHIDPNAPLPKVASLAQPGEKPVIIPSNERFVGPDSIYTVPAGPAAGPGAYDPAAPKPASTGPAFDKAGAERFSGHQSIYRKVHQKSARHLQPPPTALPLLVAHADWRYAHTAHMCTQPSQPLGARSRRALARAGRGCGAPPSLRSSAPTSQSSRPSSRRQQVSHRQQCPRSASRTSSPLLTPTRAGSFQRGAALKAALNATMEFKYSRARIPESVPE